MSALPFIKFRFHKHSQHLYIVGDDQAHMRVNRGNYRTIVDTIAATFGGQVTNDERERVVKILYEAMHTYQCIHCFAGFASKGQLTGHMNRIHSTVRPFACTQCDSAFLTAPELASHVAHIHSDVRIPCTVPGCFVTFATEAVRAQHIQEVHVRTRPHVCTWPGCTEAFIRAEHLRQHVTSVHLQADPCCPECGVQCPARHMNRHMLTHGAPRIHHCPYPDCSFHVRGLTTRQNIERHLAWHRNDRTIACAEPTCPLKFFRQHHADGHFRRCHCENPGPLHHRPDESRIHALLTREGHEFDYEKRFYFTDNTGRETFAKVDFVIKSPSVLILLEVDEEQHSHIAYSCETQRMTAIMESLALAGNVLPVVFIRYNPDKYEIGDAVHNPSFAHREGCLATMIRNLQASVPERPVTVQYMFYDCEEDNKTLSIWVNPGFSTVFREAFCCEPFVVIDDAIEAPAAPEAPAAAAAAAAVDACSTY